MVDPHSLADESGDLRPDVAAALRDGRPLPEARGERAGGAGASLWQVLGVILELIEALGQAHGERGGQRAARPVPAAVGVHRRAAPREAHTLVGALCFAAVALVLAGLGVRALSDRPPAVHPTAATDTVAPPRLTPPPPPQSPPAVALTQPPRTAVDKPIPAAQARRRPRPTHAPRAPQLPPAVPTAPAPKVEADLAERLSTTAELPRAHQRTLPPDTTRMVRTREIPRFALQVGHPRVRHERPTAFAYRDRVRPPTRYGASSHFAPYLPPGARGGEAVWGRPSPPPYARPSSFPAYTRVRAHPIFVGGPVSAYGPCRFVIAPPPAVQYLPHGIVPPGFIQIYWGTTCRRVR